MTALEARDAEIVRGAGTDGALQGGMAGIEDHSAWPMISRLPVKLAVRVPMNRFRVRDLLGLDAGQTIQSAWATGGDVPLMAAELQLGWGEFEIVEQHIAVRLTRLV